MNDRADEYRRARKVDPALPLAENVLEIRKATLGPAHSRTVVIMNTLALIHQAARKYGITVTPFAEAHELTKAKFPPDPAR